MGKKIQLVTQLRAYISLIIIRIEESVKYSFLNDSNEQLLKQQNSSTLKKKSHYHPQYQKFDLTVISAMGLPILGVEVKTRLNTSIDWVMQFYRNLMEQSNLQDLPFFLIVLGLIPRCLQRKI